MPLSDAAARIAKSRKNTHKITDPSGIFFNVSPAGGKYWRMKHSVGDHEKRIAFGVYPDVSVAQACERCGEARDAPNTAHRVQQKCGKIVWYAVATGRAQRDSSGDQRGAIPHAREHHHPTNTEPKRLGELLRAIVS